MRKFSTVLFPVVLLLLLQAGTGCRNQSHKDLVARDQQLDSCIGNDYNETLDQLTEAFGVFLIDNRFCRSDKELLKGYKNWLGFLLEGKGMDSTWKFRVNELESLLTRMEQLNFAEMMYREEITHCVLELSYPNDWMMHRFREIMPQHSVSPEVLAREFIKSVDEQQFSDPVLKKVIALEYFLGPILHVLRPDEMYLASGS
ncbi:MAG TPA: hypothetical protein P5228_01495 [Bacteroidales bacterium]|nr:hypothetical protein [Bacteroidales bacterium]HRZ48903.1 hypothetical protein [Bacteroidales bacterium]